MSDLKAKVESLELEKIELERKNLDILANLKSESPEENLKILDEGAEEVGEIKHKLLGEKIIENILKSQKLEWMRGNFKISPSKWSLCEKMKMKPFFIV